MKLVWLSWKDLTHPLAGGAEVITHNLLSRAAADGHEVCLITSRYEGSAEREERSGYTIVRGGNRFTVYSTARRYLKRNLASWADLVVEEVNTVPFFARRVTRGRVVLFFHQLCREIWFYQMAWPLSWLGYLVFEPRWLRALSSMPTITVSESTRDDLKRFGFRSVEVISEGVEVERHASLPPKDRSGKARTILSLGALRPMKRTHLQVEAFLQAGEQLPGTRLVVAGDATDPYASRVRDLVRRHPLGGRVEILGRVDGETKLRLMREADLILVSSVKEGWGLIVTEAASQGTPALVFDVDGLRDAVQKGAAGWLCAPTVQDMASELIRIASLSEPEYEAMRLAAWEFSGRITMENNYQEFMDACKALQSSNAANL